MHGPTCRTTTGDKKPYSKNRRKKRKTANHKNAGTQVDLKKDHTAILGGGNRLKRQGKRRAREGGEKKTSGGAGRREMDRE